MVDSSCNDKSVTVETKSDVYIDQSVNQRSIPVNAEKNSLGGLAMYFLKNPAKIREWMVIIFLVFLIATGFSMRDLFDRFLPPKKAADCTQPLPTTSP